MLDFSCQIFSDWLFSLLFPPFLLAVHVHARLSLFPYIFFFSKNTSFLHRKKKNAIFFSKCIVFITFYGDLRCLNKTSEKLLIFYTVRYRILFKKKFGGILTSFVFSQFSIKIRTFSVFTSSRW